jgi:hypothetical protein
MKRAISIGIMIMLVFWIVGCRENSSPHHTKNQTKNITVGISREKSDKKTIFQKASDIMRIVLDVNHTSNGTVVYDCQNKEMSKINNVWSVNLSLDPSNSPFSFRATAFDAVTGGNPIYTGTIVSDLTNGQMNISIVLKDVTGTDRGTLPWVKNISISDINSTTKEVEFTISNEQKDNLDYNISTNNGSFSPADGSLTFANQEIIFDSNYTHATSGNKDCNITLTNPRGDKVTFGFSIDGNTVTVNTPPNIDHIDVEYGKQIGYIDITATVDDLEDNGFDYLWTITRGAVTILNDSNSSNPLKVSGYKQNAPLCVALETTDNNPHQAKSRVNYCIRTPLSSPNPSTLPKTGQTKQYQSYDDGYYQMGKKRRFERIGTERVVIDREQNLTWQDNSDVNSTTKTWAAAGSYCGALNLYLHNDWRLPTIEELLYITDKGRVIPAIDPTFKYVSSDVYWSSTTLASDSSYAWTVYFDYGYDYRNGKTYEYYVRCVRGGQ